MKFYPRQPGPQGCNRIRASAREQIAFAMRPRAAVRSDNQIARLFSRHGPALRREVLALIGGDIAEAIRYATKGGRK